MVKSAYYYLVASLPMLDFSMSPPIAYEDFLQRCREQLLEHDMKIIERTTIKPSEQTEDECAILKEWKKFDVGLRNELVRMRVTKKNKDASSYIRGEDWHDPFAAHFAHLVYNQGSPQESEKIFDRIRWEKIEDLKLGHFFDVDYLIAYALQLQILQRWVNVNQEKGMQILEELLSKI